MPNIKLVAEGIPNLLPMLDRSPGLHLSDVINDICISLGYYQASELDMTRLQLGCAVEHALTDRLSQHYPNRYYNPGELYLDDLPVTPDLADTLIDTDLQQSYPFAMDEIKSTWLSSRHVPGDKKFDKYLWQLMAQCSASRTTLGHLHVVNFNGDYVHPYKPAYRKWRLVFGEKELQANRTMILRHRDLMIRQGKGK